ncbi:MAG: hypothetical protein GX994_02335 [Firmicutes bacterium]|nr:hypothetical protein [Bacillota bacterium]
MWLDQNKTLLISLNRDTWQLPVRNNTGDYLGNVVAQIVEPKEYLVRYFLIYNPNQERRFLLPSDTVTAIDEWICCTIGAEYIAQLPDYTQSLEREDEIRIYQIISQTPYWENHLIN